MIFTKHCNSPVVGLCSGLADSDKGSSIRYCGKCKYGLQFNQHQHNSVHKPAVQNSIKADTGSTTTHTFNCTIFQHKFSLSIRNCCLNSVHFEALYSCLDRITLHFSSNISLVSTLWNILGATEWPLFQSNFRRPQETLPP